DQPADRPGRADADRADALLHAGLRREANGELIERLKHAQTIVVEAKNLTGQKISLNFPLAHFSQTYDGPGSAPKATSGKGANEPQREHTEAVKQLPQTRRPGSSRRPDRAAAWPARPSRARENLRRGRSDDSRDHRRGDCPTTSAHCTTRRTAPRNGYRDVRARSGRAAPDLPA
ncbi:hypothetical protein chiPu_0031277, partial [Chiloscyllium punctatum]|nr:hypothetical protein [Chiloscyllium punctatum]